MKNNISFISLFVSVFLLLSCGFNNKSKDNDKMSENMSFDEYYMNQPSILMQNSDTAEVLSVVNEYISYLSNNDFESAAAMLHYVENESVHPLNDIDKNQFVKQFSQMKIYDCKMKGFTFRSEYNNSVTISLQILENGDIEKDFGVTKFNLNPVFYQGEWFLTLLDKNAEGVKDSYSVE